MSRVLIIVYGIAAIVWTYQFCNRNALKPVVIMRHRFSGLKRSVLLTNLWSYALSTFLCFYFGNWMFTTLVVLSHTVAAGAWISIYDEMSRTTADSITAERNWSDDLISLFQITTALFIFFMSAEKILSGH